MATLKNISDEDLECTPLNHRVVKKGETVDVPDDLVDPANLIWPAATWLINGKPQKDPAPTAEQTPPAAPDAPAAPEVTE